MYSPAFTPWMATTLKPTGIRLKRAKDERERATDRQVRRVPHILDCEAAAAAVGAPLTVVAVLVFGSSDASVRVHLQEETLLAEETRHDSFELRL